MTKKYNIVRSKSPEVSDHELQNRVRAEPGYVGKLNIPYYNSKFIITKLTLIQWWAAGLVWEEDRELLQKIQDEGFTIHGERLG